MINDLLSDAINKIKLAYSSNLEYVFVFYSKFIFSIFNILKFEGYLNDFYLFFIECKKFLLVYLKYFNNKPVIQFFGRISKLSLSVYKRRNNLPRVMNGLGICLLSTNYGLITDKVARSLGVGGKLICYVF